MEGNMLVLPERDGRRIAISLEEDAEEEVAKRTEQGEKEERRAQVRAEGAAVAQFVHGYLVRKLRYSDDHKRCYLPKKFVLQLYLNWCKQQGRTLLFADELSMVQMFLTNELKIAFNRIDVYSNNYKGLALTSELTYKSTNDHPNKSTNDHPNKSTTDHPNKSTSEHPNKSTTDHPNRSTPEHPNRSSVPQNNSKYHSQEIDLEALPTKHRK
jgi:hypothetical protein